MNTRILLTALMCGTFGLSAQAQDNWTIEGFDMPESAIVDSARGRIILSTIIGNPTAADGIGSLALLSTDGTLLDANWVSGLDAPKGMAIIDDTLLVADLTRIHEIDLATGELMRSHTIPDAVFLNDITSNGEVAFVSDMMTNSLWIFQDGVPSLWLKTNQLNNPNGLYLEDDQLFVGSWGAGIRDDFTTETPGALLSIALNTQEITVVAADIGNLDGVTRMGSEIVVNDWITGAIFAVDDNGDVSKIAQHKPGLADISSDGNTLYLPMMLDGTLSAISYP